MTVSCSDPRTPVSKTSVTHVLYLHGFRSSPQSAKASRLAGLFSSTYPDVHWWCPQLPPSPLEASKLISEGTTNWPKESMAVIGSSLGGFYATWLAHLYDCKAVLINPAIDPARDLAKYIGEHSVWHDPNERIYFALAYIEELHNLYVGEFKDPQKVFALIAKGDEVLDWREMTGRYPRCLQLVLEGSDHGVSDFELHLPRLMQFLFDSI
jgi:predicted esterase YcpF (UPF0227 family)